MADKQVEGLKMIALVEFDEAINKDVYEKLKELYDFGEVTDRVFKDYNCKLKPMEQNEYFKDEVEKVEDEYGDSHFVLKANKEKTIESYYLRDRAQGDWIGITNTKHVVDLKELYTACRKAQVRILEVARID